MKKINDYEYLKSSDQRESLTKNFEKREIKNENV